MDNYPAWRNSPGIKQLHPPQPVKLIMGLISSQEELFEQACQQLTDHWGEVDLVSPVFPFYHTDYYQPEMGSNLLRRFVSFQKLIPPDNLVACKILSNQIEAVFADEQNRRRINLDPGHVNLYQVVLASTKEFAHRIYLGEGIYAELTLQYKKGNHWQDLPWTYPDYRLATTKEFLSQVRQQYRQQLHK